MVVTQEHDYPLTPGFRDPTCAVCQEILAFVGGWVVRSVAKQIKCADCVYAFHVNSSDMIEATALIRQKSYQEQLLDEYNWEQDWFMPSGSFLTILIKFESLARSQKFRKSPERGVMLGMTESIKRSFQDIQIFPSHQEHREELLNIVFAKFSRSQIQKALNDDNIAISRGGGNYIHRSKIFQGKW